MNAVLLKNILDNLNSKGFYENMVRQESLASTYRVKVPIEKGLTNHSYRVLR